MTTHRLLCTSLLRGISNLSIRSSVSRVSTPACRFFSDKDKPPTEDDPFGVLFDDGLDKVGPPDQLPPKYKRDAATGRFTGDIERELTEEEKRILAADPIELDAVLKRRIGKKWASSRIDESGYPEELNELGKRIRQANMGLNVLGRSVQAQASAEKLDDGDQMGRDETGFSQILTKGEFESFQKFMKDKQKIDVSEDDIPVQGRSAKRVSNDDIDPDDARLSLKWLTLRAQLQMDDTRNDNPYSDLMPGDMSPSRLVNRKRAKQIPLKLVHHNNINLLQSFITPTGKIIGRIQTRLGARDQRRIAKCIKRARSLGLLPYLGQFKCEQHGWKHAKDIHTEKPWEQELAKRGLVIKPSREQHKRDM